MVSEIVEVIVKVFEGIKKENSLLDVEKLLPAGVIYHKNIIPAAYSWIYDKSVRITYGIKKSALQQKAASEFYQMRKNPCWGKT